MESSPAKALASCMAATRLHKPPLSAQMPLPGLISGFIVVVFTVKLACGVISARAEAGMKSSEYNSNRESMRVNNLRMFIEPPVWAQYERKKYFEVKLLMIIITELYIQKN